MRTRGEQSSEYIRSVLPQVCGLVIACLSFSGRFCLCSICIIMLVDTCSLFVTDSKPQTRGGCAPRKHNSPSRRILPSAPFSRTYIYTRLRWRGLRRTANKRAINSPSLFFYFSGDVLCVFFFVDTSSAGAESRTRRWSTRGTGKVSATSLAQGISPSLAAVISRSTCFSSAMVSRTYSH